MGCGERHHQRLRQRSVRPPGISDTGTSGANVDEFFEIIFDFPLIRRDCRSGLDAKEAANPHEYYILAGLRPLFIRLELRDKTANGAQIQRTLIKGCGKP